MLTFADNKTLIAMKNSIIIAALMCCIVSASAKQNCNENDLTVKLDSIKSVGRKFLFEYDTHLNCTRCTEYMYISDSIGWNFMAFNEYTYDELYRMTSKTTYEPFGNGMRKYEYFYNGQGLLSEVTYSYYNGTNWHFIEKYYYEYDEEMNQILYIQYKHEDGNWEEVEKKVWEYAGGLPWLILRYYFGTLYDKTEYDYNEQGLCSEMIRSIYIVEPMVPEWKEYYKELYEYDEAGNLLTKTILDGNSNGLYYRKKTELAYDGNNNCTNISEYSGYDNNTGQWLYLNKEFGFVYDSTVNINNIAGLSSFWKEYFDLDIPLFNELQLVTIDMGDVIQYDFYYSNSTGLDEPKEILLSVWPNPATEKVHVGGIEIAEVQVYNTLGQLMKTVQNSNEVDVSNLPQGVYLLRITDAEGKNRVARVMKK